MLARNSDLYLDVRASCLAFSSSSCRACSTSAFLRSTSWFCRAKQPGLFLQLLVGLLQFFLPNLQLMGQRLRLLEQVFGEHVGVDRVEHDGDRLGKLLEEGLVRGIESFERRQFQDAADLPFVNQRQHKHAARRPFTQARRDADIVGRARWSAESWSCRARTGRRVLRPGGSACRARPCRWCRSRPAA